MKKRILHLTYDMHIGGTEQVIKNLIGGSDPALFDMSIFCIEKPVGPFGQMLIENGTTITCHQRKDGFDLKLIKVIRQHIKKCKIDILHCHQYTPWVYGALAATLTNVKVIFTEHGRFFPDSSSWKRRLVNPWLIKLTHSITAISKSTRQALVDFEYIPKQNIIVIYNGIQAVQANYDQTQNLKKELAITGNTIVLGTIARLDPIKNHKMMLKAFKQVLSTSPNTILIIVGDGEERNNLENLAAKLDLSNKVIFLGFKPKPENYLNLMDIFLLSSLSEGTSMTLLEAMSLSKPCIVTAAGGNPEIIVNGHNGLVTKNDEPDEFSSANLTLINDVAMRKTMAKNAGERFEMLYTENRMCEDYQLIYK